MKDNPGNIESEIETADWNLLIKRLLVYTAYQLSQHGMPRAEVASAAGEYVTRAVQDVLAGEIQLSPAPLFAALAAAVRLRIEKDGDPSEATVAS